MSGLMHRKRRRHDSDDDQDDHAPGPLVAHEEDVGELVIDNNILRALGMDDLISDEDETELVHGGSPNNTADEHLSTDVLVLPSKGETEAPDESALNRAQVGCSTTTLCANKRTVASARINVAAHVRDTPCGEKCCGDGAVTLKEFIAAAQSVLEAPSECFSAEQRMSIYRCDQEMRKRHLAVGTGGAAAAVAPKAEARVTWENRFGTCPGWRWDGVVRGTGAETRFFGVSGKEGR